MFSGITQGLFQVIVAYFKDNIFNYTIKLSPKLCENLVIGASISVNGVCQSVMHLNQDEVSFQAINETLDKTTLGSLKVGDYVSIERSLRWGDEVGGHEVSGHIYGTGEIHQRFPSTKDLTIIIKCDPAWMRYILPKGFIAIDGSSLTVGETDSIKGLFYIHLIPETLRVTQFDSKQIGDAVNIEFDQKTKTIIDTVERVIQLTR